MELSYLPLLVLGTKTGQFIALFFHTRMEIIRVLLLLFFNSAGKRTVLYHRVTKES